MKLSALITQRQSLLEQARLANLAFAYERLSEFASRIARARLSGAVQLQALEPETGHYLASLTALQGSQSVIEEHFTDEDLMDLADVLSYATDEEEMDFTFSLEDLAEVFLTPLKTQLVQAGVELDAVETPGEESGHENSTGCSREEGG